MYTKVRRAARARPATARVVASAFLVLVLLAVADRAFRPPTSRSADLSVVVTDSKGRMLRPFLARDGAWRLPVSMQAVDGQYLRMLKAYEDRRFDVHWGVDPFAVVRALAQFASNGHVVSGASTLTMQTARLMAPGRRGLGAKVIQGARAMQLEWRHSKPEILSLYLTLAPFGGNLEGVRAASLAYFGKEPAALTLGEAALLVALPQSPERLRPDRHPLAARAGRDKVLFRLAERGVISRERAREAMAEPVPTARRSLPFHAPHLAERLARAAPAGAELRTTLDGALQGGLESLARREALRFPDGANLALLVVDNDTRAIRAYVGNADYWGKHGGLDLTRAVRSPGSALKPFAYGMIFDDFAGHPQTLIEDRPTVFGSYAPRNFDRGFQGTVSLRQALQLSLNVPAVALLERIGPARFAGRLQTAGARLHFPSGVAGPSLPLILGGVGISLEDLTMLYTGLARDGAVAPLRALQSDEPGREVRLFAPLAAWYVRDSLRGSPLPDGWSAARGIERRPIAFKTGTSYGFRDAWAVGMSPRFTVGVWVGRPDGSTRPGSYGRNAAAPLLLRAFDLLPSEPLSVAAAPKGALMATASSDLPLALQHFHIGRMASLSQSDPRRRLSIAFPPDGASVSLPWGNDAPTLALRAVGGRGRLFWLVDGTPLPAAATDGHRAFWHPEGQGFARISVSDDAGNHASVNVRLTSSR